MDSELSGICNGVSASLSVVKMGVIETSSILYDIRKNSLKYQIGQSSNSSGCVVY